MKPVHVEYIEFIRNQLQKALIRSKKYDSLADKPWYAGYVDVSEHLNLIKHRARLLLNDGIQIPEQFTELRDVFGTPHIEQLQREFEDAVSLLMKTDSDSNIEPSLSADQLKSISQLNTTQMKVLKYIWNNERPTAEKIADSKEVNKSISHVNSILKKLRQLDLIHNTGKGYAATYSGK